MATAGERAAIGAEEARLEGRGPVGDAVQGAEAAARPGRTGFRGPRTTAGERGALGAEEARLEGRGPVGEAVQGAEAAARPGRTGVGAGVGPGVGPGVGRTTAGERAAIGAEDARMRGRGRVGEAVEGAELAAEGRRGLRNQVPGEGFGDGSVLDEGRGPHHFGLNEGVRTIVSNEGEAYCPNPNIRDLVSANAQPVVIIFYKTFSNLLDHCS